MSLQAERQITEYEKPHEACGVFGVLAASGPAALCTYEGLRQLQNRGQEGAGIFSSDGLSFKYFKSLGLVSKGFNPDVICQLDGSITGRPAVLALGHTRYSTTGSNHESNLGPFRVKDVVVSHNGNLTNARSLRELLRQVGFVPSSTTDSELIAASIAYASGSNLGEKIVNASALWWGSYSLIIASLTEMYAVRDPMGNRPLAVGAKHGSWIVASESHAIEQVGGAFLGELVPGEVCQISSNGLLTVHFIPPRFSSPEIEAGLCSFEYIYLARPESVINNRLVHTVRRRLGAGLARLAPIEADLVIDVPDSARPIGIGYAQASGIPYDEAILRNRWYVGRTFMDPNDGQRGQGVTEKYTYLRQVIEGKRLVVVDDSIVRGTTTTRLVAILRRLGAKEVHLRIGAPPLRHPCRLGVDFDTHGELLASGRSVEEMERILNVDSLAFSSIEAMLEAMGSSRNKMCIGCFTGHYPELNFEEVTKHGLEVPRTAPAYATV